jgi:transcriptional regulator with XRE-family HTH domain
MISGVQIRAGRALLGWDQARLAEAAGVSVITVKRLEAAGEELHAQFATVIKVKSAFERAGVLFLGQESGLGYGVRLRDLTRQRGGAPSDRPRKGSSKPT